MQNKVQNFHWNCWSTHSNCRIPERPAAETNAKPCTTRTQPFTLWQVDYIGPLYPGRAAIFSSQTWNYLWIQVCLFCLVPLPGAQLKSLYLIKLHRIFHNITSDQGAILREKVWPWVPDSGIHSLVLPYRVPSWKQLA